MQPHPALSIWHGKTHRKISFYALQISGRGRPRKTKTPTGKHPKRANKQILHTHGHTARTQSVHWGKFGNHESIKTPGVKISVNQMAYPYHVWGRDGY